MKSACQLNSKSVQLDVHNHGWQQSQETFPIRLFGVWTCSRTFIPQPPRALVFISRFATTTGAIKSSPNLSPPIAIAEQSFYSSEYVLRGRSTLFYTNWKVRTLTLDLRPKSDPGARKGDSGPVKSLTLRDEHTRNAKSRHLSSFLRSSQPITRQFRQSMLPLLFCEAPITIMLEMEICTSVWTNRSCESGITMWRLHNVKQNRRCNIIRKFCL
jgi:hypothetical protein